MAMFKSGAGPGKNQGKGTKPEGGWGAQKSRPGTKTGSNNKQATQMPDDCVPKGKYGSAGEPKGSKPEGKWGSRSGPGSKKANPATKPPSGYYKDRSGYSAPVPKGQSANKNTIPNGQDNTPKIKIRL